MTDKDKIDRYEATLILLIEKLNESGVISYIDRNDLENVLSGRADLEDM